MPLVEPIQGDAFARAAWSMGYFGRTLYFNGPGGSKAAKAFLRDEREVADPDHIEDILRRGGDPIDDLLDRTIRICYPRLGRQARGAKRARWELAEPTLNARCRLGLALLTPPMVGRTMSRLLSRDLPDRSLRLSRIHPDLDDKRRIGIPDVLLSGPRYSILIEMKVRGLPSWHMYDLKQMVQYLNLAINDALQNRRRRAVHILLRPAGGGAICRRRDVWFPEARNGRPVSFEAGRLARIVRTEAWAPRLGARLALQSLSRVPVFERTYPELFAAVPKAAWRMANGQAARRQLELVVENAEPVKRSRT